jgi:hypothetical protein
MFITAMDLKFHVTVGTIYNAYKIKEMKTYVAVDIG